MWFEAWDIWVDRVLHCNVARVRIVLCNWWFFLEQGTKAYEIIWISHLEIDTSHDIQNELLEIMAHHVLRKKIEKLRKCIFSIIDNEYTDISTKEHLSLCLRSVKENLNVQQDFLGFYFLTNIKSETIVNTIKDTYLDLIFNSKIADGSTKY